MGRVRCDYHDKGFRCQAEGVYGVQFDGRPVRLCVTHAEPRFHPPDLHKKLPGRVRRALTGAR